MKAISVRQPWAWLIIHAGKDIENRSWRSHHRGRTLIHASRSLSLGGYYDCQKDVEPLGIQLPPRSELLLGGIIGAVDIVDCVTDSDSPWFSGPYGFLLRNPTPLPFREVIGQLGFFEVAYDPPEVTSVPATHAAR